jgi:prepilin-type N-terminal cleavage/methylation domain-containing protein
MNSQSGLSLVEILVVMTLIVVLALFAVPSLLQARTMSRETGTVVALRNIFIAQELFRTLDADADGAVDFATNLSELGSTGLLTDEALAAGERHEFSFVLTTTDAGYGFTCFARPLGSQPIQKYFRVDETGVVRFSIDADPDETSLPVGE